ncbi:MAG TPA: hypothetical protein VIU41_00125 [Geobacteraceae bacterium]
MTENRAEQAPGGTGRLRRWLVWLALLSLLLAAVATLAAKLYLASPLPARQLSRLLTERLGQPATVAGLSLAGGTVRGYGLRLDNQIGVGGPPLLACGSLELAPAWGELLHGRKQLGLVRLTGLAVALQRDRSGAWNFAALRQRFATTKGEGSELLIDRLELTDGALSVDGKGVTGLQLAVHDLATKGSRLTRFTLSGKEPYGSRFSLAGQGRLGRNPELAIDGTLPDFSLATWQKAGSPLQLTKSSVNARLRAQLANSRLSVTAEAGLRDAGLATGGDVVPLAATLQLAGDYGLAEDRVVIGDCQLAVDRLVRLQGHGSMQGVRTARQYSGELRWAPLELTQLLPLLPEKVRRDLALAGRLEAGTLHVAGSRAGLDRLDGSLQLTGGRVARAGKPLVENLAARLALAQRPAGWEVTGEVTAVGSGQRPLVESLAMPVKLTLDQRFRLRQASVAGLTARLLGTSAIGSFRYTPAAREPLQGGIAMERLALAELGRFLPGQQVAISAGSGRVIATVTGPRPADLTASVQLAVSGFRGTLAGKPVSLASGAVTGEFRRNGRELTGSGTVRLDDGSLAGTPVGATFAYGVTPGQAVLRTLQASYGQQAFNVAELAAALPPAQSPAGTLPLRLSWHGLEAQTGGVALTGGSGRLTADFHRAGERRWLSGSGELAVATITGRGVTGEKLAASLTFRERELAAAVTGRLLSGNLSGTVALNPFAVKDGVRYAFQLTGAEAAALAGLLPAKRAPVLTGGQLDAIGSGSYRAGAGPAGSLTLTGRELALADANGKSLLSDGSLRLGAELRDGTLQLRDSELGLGEGVTIAVAGSVEQLLTPTRHGAITLSLPATPLTTIFDRLANQLPRALQEAEVAGTIAVRSQVAIAGKGVVVDGTSRWAGVKLEVPTQKLFLTGIDGTIPFSLDLAGSAVPFKRPELAYSRDNYPRLLAARGAPPAGGELFAIQRFRFGGIDLANTAIRLRAGQGLTEVTSLETLLYGGRLVGSGFFRLKDGPQYGGDLLLNEVSLRSLCEAIPAIKGYISGRVDGVISLYGSGRESSGLNGFVDLWTRSGEGEPMLVSKEFLQKLAGKKLKGFFFRSDRTYDTGEISAYLENGFLTFDRLDISHTNLLGIRDLSVSVAAVQNRIGLAHLLDVVKEAATRGKSVSTGGGEGAPPLETEFKWSE